MITSLRVQNFRSILSTDVRFAESGLTVVVGANGSGKSNFVKSLEFIAGLNTEGLPAAIARQGGLFSVLPKSIPVTRLENQKTLVRYVIELPKPKHFVADGRAPTVAHNMQLQWGRRRAYGVVEESLHFSEPIAAARALRATRSERESAEVVDASTLEASPPSSISFSRQAGRIHVQSDPSFDPPNLVDYFEWLGFHVFAGLGVKVQSGEDLRGLLDTFAQTRTKAGVELDLSMSMLDLGEGAPFAIAPQTSIFRECASNIRRFDLQLAELRKEQDVVRSHELTAHGSHLPAVVQWVKRSKDESRSWARVESTLADIAPHVHDVSVNTLKTGREYVEFLETKGGRKVESWESSDGTLRALAILLAIETHPEYGTVIVEEPEHSLHPWAVRTVMAHMREVIKERHLQLILTTHSQQVLDEASPDEVLVASRTAQEGTVLQSVRELLPHATIESGEIGRMWVKGLLGGVPQYQTP